jgi:hypothetical protein
MNLNSIAEGLVIKNYKELCTLLNEPIKAGGKVKQLQLEGWKQYFNYEKKGHSFIITEIYKEPQKQIVKTNKRNSLEYINIIALLISDLLAKGHNNGEVFLSKHRLFKELKMINNNYAFCKQRILKLSAYTNIKTETIEEWYDSTDSALKRNLEKALYKLKQESLIIWSSEITICKLNVEGYNPYTDNFDINKKVYKDKYDEEITEYETNTYVKDYIREATDTEKKKIIYIEREVMKNLECKDKQEIIKNGKWEQFKESVNDILLKEMNIAYYYESYKILYNEEHICEKYESLIDLLLNDKERAEYYSNLNANIKKRIAENATRRQQRALRKIESETENEKLQRRIESNYIQDNETLTNILVDKNTKSIIKEIKKTKY